LIRTIVIFLIEIMVLGSGRAEVDTAATHDAYRA
jgi:hypothetical protein